MGNFKDHRLQSHNMEMETDARDESSHLRILLLENSKKTRTLFAGGVALMFNRRSNPQIPTGRGKLIFPTRN